MISCAAAVALLATLLAGDEAATAGPSGETSEIRIRAGTPVSLRLVDRVTARALKPGSTIQVQIAVPLIVGSCDVLPQGAPAEMLVIQSRPASLAGAPDRLVLRALRAMDKDGRWVSLEGEYSISGEDRSLESVGGAATVSCVFLAMRGDPVVLAAGSGWIAFVGSDQHYLRCR